MEQEQQRHQYLAAMGVASWLPRTALPGAGPSAEWVDDFQYPAPEIPFSSDRSGSARAGLSGVRQEVRSAPSVVPHNPAAKVEAPAGISAARAALIGSVTEQSAPLQGAPPQSGFDARPSVISQNSVQSPSTAPIPDGAATQTVISTDPNTESGEAVLDSTPPNFKLMFLRIGDLLIVDSMPPQGGVYTDQYGQLAQAIASSLGLAGDLGEPFMLPWPMFASKTLDQSRAQAVIAVQHKLNKELHNRPATAMLLLGEASAQMVLDRPEALDELRGITFTLQQGVNVLASQSLTELMYLPGAKRALWLDLQPLIAKLATAHA